MPPLTPDEEITHSEPLVNLTDVRARIPVLKPFHVEDSRDYADFGAYATREEAEAYIAGQGENIRPYLEITEYDDEAGELAALRELEAAMAGLGERASAISEGYLAEFVHDEIEDVVGSDALAILDRYVRWEDIEAERAAEMTRFTYRGGTFYLTR